MNSKLTLLLIVIFLSCSYSVTYSADEPDINDAVSKRAIEVEIQVRWKEMITALARGDIERALTYNWYRLCGNHTPKTGTELVGRNMRGFYTFLFLNRYNSTE